MVMRLYKYVPPERVDVVRDLRIRFTPPGYLSDPFECRIAFPPTLSEDPTRPPNASTFDEDECIRLWRRMASFEWGILCLTKRPGNVRDVQYSEDRPSSGNPNEVPLSSFFVKSPDWAYEEEVRMVLPLSDADFKSEEGEIHLFRFPADALTGVILGAGATKELTEELTTLIGTQKLAHVRLQRAKLSLRTFGMEFAEA